MGVVIAYYNFSYYRRKMIVPLQVVLYFISFVLMLVLLSYVDVVYQPYLVLIPLLSQLIVSKFVYKPNTDSDENRYNITVAGRECLSQFYTRIPASLRDNISQFAQENKLQFKRNQEYIAKSYKNEDGTFEEYRVINPKIVSHSEEMIYVEEGEGCLSVNRYVEGIVPRHARMTIEAYDENGEKYSIRVREELAVGFQHELDHLDGILFTDKIDSKNPFKNKDKYRAL
jgi:peptide deformylase